MLIQKDATNTKVVMGEGTRESMDNLFSSDESGDTPKGSPGPRKGSGSPKENNKRRQRVWQKFQKEQKEKERLKRFKNFKSYGD